MGKILPSTTICTYVQVQYFVDFFTHYLGEKIISLIALKKWRIFVKMADFSRENEVFLRGSGFGQIDRTFDRTCSVYFSQTFGRTIRVRSYTSFVHICSRNTVGHKSIFTNLVVELILYVGMKALLRPSVCIYLRGFYSILKH